MNIENTATGTGVMLLSLMFFFFFFKCYNLLSNRTPPQQLFQLLAPPSVVGFCFYIREKKAVEQQK